MIEFLCGVAVGYVIKWIIVRFEISRRMRRGDT